MRRQDGVVGIFGWQYRLVLHGRPKENRGARVKGKKTFREGNESRQVLEVRERTGCQGREKHKGREAPCMNESCA